MAEKSRYEEDPPSGARARPPEDLSSDHLLRGCTSADHETGRRPMVGRIVLLARIGKGGMGVVYYGVNPRIDVEVAVKVLPWSTQEGEDGRLDRFLREARLAAKLKSDHLVRVFDADRDAATGHHFIEMEYVHGQSAGAWLRGLTKRGEVGAPEAAALDVCIAATKGLAAAHLAGVVHRDVKPDNILVPAGADGRLDFAAAKLSDLGLARPEVSDQDLTGKTLAMGTPGYMAPEQAKDARKAKKPADVFSMGATIYALLAGESPFTGETSWERLHKTIHEPHAPIRDVRPDVSPATAALLEHALAKAPADRFPDAPALLEALELCRRALDAEAPSFDTLSSVAQLVQRDERGAPVVSDTPAPPATPTPTRPAERTATETPTAPPSDPRRRQLTWIAAGVGVLAFGAYGVHRLARPTPGLFVESDPPRAVVVIDGRDVGRTPLLVRDLADGTHAVRMTAPHYRPFEATDAVAKDDERTEFRAVLVRGVGSLSVSGGAPGARVALVRDGTPSKEYAFTLDEKGALAAKPVETGEYAATCSLAGYIDFRGRLTVPEETGTALSAPMREHDGLLSIDSAPGGATVFVDDAQVGATPMTNCPAPGGDRRITLRLARHADFTTNVRIRGDQALQLGRQTLLPWGTLDLSRLGDGVYAWKTVGSQTVQLAHGEDLPPQPIDVCLTKADQKTQRVRVTPTPGTACPIAAGAWERSSGTVDLSALEPDVTATCDGRVLRQGDPLLTGTREVELGRSGYGPQRVRVQIEQDKAARVQALPWSMFQARLEFADVPGDARFLVNGRSVTGSVTFASATKPTVTLERPHLAYETQTHEVTCKLGETAIVRPRAWTPSRDVLRVRVADGSERRWALTARTTGADPEPIDETARHSLRLVSKATDAMGSVAFVRFDELGKSSEISAGATGSERLRLDSPLLPLPIDKVEVGSEWSAPFTAPANYHNGEFLNDVEMNVTFQVTRIDDPDVVELSARGKGTGLDRGTGAYSDQRTTFTVAFSGTVRLSKVDGMIVTANLTCAIGELTRFTGSDTKLNYSYQLTLTMERQTPRR